VNPDGAEAHTARRSTALPVLRRRGGAWGLRRHDWRLCPGQQPRNQPTPRRTKFGDGTFLAGVGVALGVVLGVVLKTKNALRWGLGLFRASSQCNQGGPKSQEPRGGLGGLGRTYTTQTQMNRQWGCSYGLHNRSRQGSRPGRRARESASSRHGIKEVRVRRLALSRRHTPALEGFYVKNMAEKKN
jgi:hypothetical protein